MYNNILGVYMVQTIHTKPTTMRLSPEVRNQLWMMKQELGYTKMDDVVKHLIQNYQGVEA